MSVVSIGVQCVIVWYYINIDFSLSRIKLDWPSNTIIILKYNTIIKIKKKQIGKLMLIIDLRYSRVKHDT